MRRSWLAGAMFVGLTASAGSASAAVFWNAGVRSRDITVCFVGDAVTKRPERVAEIMTHVRDIELSANIRFKWMGACPPPTKAANGHDRHDGDIRIVISGVSVNWRGMIPGVGCPAFMQDGVYDKRNDGGGSWSNPPNDLERMRACAYNLKQGADGLGGKAYPAHTLHEFGHALGLSHEHSRADIDKIACANPHYGGGTKGAFLTPYDRLSVMHYNFPTCGIAGNYSFGGLSAWDQLALQLMYPEDRRVLVLSGKTVLAAGEPLRVGLDWGQRGANLPVVVKTITWSVGGTVRGNAHQLVQLLPAGQHRLQVQLTDWLGRDHAASLVVRVHEPAQHRRILGAAAAAMAW